MAYTALQVSPNEQKNLTQRRRKAVDSRCHSRSEIEAVVVDAATTVDEEEEEAQPLDDVVPHTPLDASYDENRWMANQNRIESQTLIHITP
ncbi:unnamed protein product [Soboliphyme baturini]|uniref:Uncharacterized protein n=1 Tax=Soboliphyme baturini TaxID=241478 RepID=A0A183J7A3_9BILA|nr:unnamed protein product [Soboliphyme baturini]